VCRKSRESISIGGDPKVSIDWGAHYMNKHSTELINIKGIGTERQKRI
jgi:hypothetical protein